jgi:hypothetical protein
MGRKFLLLAVLSLSVAVNCHSQAHQEESLRGLHGVFVYVHPVGKDIEAGGLSTGQVRNAVEKALHEAGIIVYGEPQPAEGSANLIIEINLVKHPQGPYLYGVEVGLVQEVHLSRTKGSAPLPAKTWTANALGLTSANRTDLILEPVIDKVNEFISEYRGVNRPARN